MGTVQYHSSLLRKDFFILVNRSLAYNPCEVDKSYPEDLLWVISFFKMIHLHAN